MKEHSIYYQWSKALMVILFSVLMAVLFFSCGEVPQNDATPNTYIITIMGDNIRVGFTDTIKADRYIYAYNKSKGLSDATGMVIFKDSNFNYVASYSFNYNFPIIIRKIK